MKRLLIPIVVGLLAGLGGGSGYAYMRASAKFAADSAFLADSLKKFPPDSSHSKSDTEAKESLSANDALADSLETAIATDSGARASSSVDSTGGAAKAPPVAGTHAPPRASGSMAPTTPTAPPATAGKSPSAKPDAPGVAGNTANTGKVSQAQSVASIVTDARDAANRTQLPQQRLAKIFATMPAKDAARVLEQMNDADIREIMALMSDRQAAAIMSVLPPARAAAITGVRAKASGEKGTPK